MSNIMVNQQLKYSSSASNRPPFQIKNKKEKDLQINVITRRLSTSAPNTPLAKKHTPPKAKQPEHIKQMTETLKTNLKGKKTTKRSSMIVNGTKRQDLHVKIHQRSNSATDKFMYAGPVFNNSPEPSTLPVPSFVPIESIHPSNTSSFSFSFEELSLAEIQRKLRAILKL